MEYDILDTDEEVFVKPSGKVHNYTIIALAINALILTISLFYALFGSSKGWLITEQELGIAGTIVFGVAFGFSLLSFKLHFQRQRSAKIVLSTISLLPIAAIIIIIILAAFS